MRYPKKGVYNINEAISVIFVIKKEDFEMYIIL